MNEVLMTVADDLTSKLSCGVISEESSNSFVFTIFGVRFTVKQEVFSGINRIRVSDNIGDSEISDCENVLVSIYSLLFHNRVTALNTLRLILWSDERVVDQTLNMTQDILTVMPFDFSVMILSVSPIGFICRSEDSEFETKLNKSYCFDDFYKDIIGTSFKQIKAPISKAEIRKLIRKGKVLGYRIKTSKGVYDIDKSVADSLGVDPLSVSKTIEMRANSSGFWVSSSEFSGEKQIQEISNDEMFCRQLFSQINFN